MIGKHGERADLSDRLDPMRVNCQWLKVSKRVFFVALSFSVFSLCAAVEAQQKTKNPRVGYLAISSASINQARVEAFEKGLRELGYAIGNNLVIEYRFLEGKPELLKKLAAELLRLKSDVIVTGGPTTTRAVRKLRPRFPL